MASKNVGKIMKHNYTKVVILRTGLSIDGSDAVKIAPLSTRRPSGSGRYVEAKTWVKDYWIALDQVKVVKSAEVVDAALPPGQLPRKLLNAVLKEMGNGS
jgi:hypothetical protein